MKTTLLTREVCLQVRLGLLPGVVRIAPRVTDDAPVEHDGIGAVELEIATLMHDGHGLVGHSGDAGHLKRYPVVEGIGNLRGPRPLPRHRTSSPGW